MKAAPATLGARLAGCICPPQPHESLLNALAVERLRGADPLEGHVEWLDPLYLITKSCPMHGLSA